jgi:5-hydroxyisourate hydrolase
MSSPLTTHVLDTARGLPAQGLALALERLVDGVWEHVANGLTDDDGRCRDLLAAGGLHAGVWRLTFETGAWYADRDEACFYPVAQITFNVTDTGRHHHVPLLLAPFGFSTYRGS